MSPYCVYDQSRLRAVERPHSHDGFYLGRFKFLVCPVCQRVYQPLATASRIEAILRAKGLFPPEVRVGSNILDPVSFEEDVEFSVSYEYHFATSLESTKFVVQPRVSEPRRTIRQSNSPLINEATA